MGMVLINTSCSRFHDFEARALKNFLKKKNFSQTEKKTRRVEMVKGKQKVTGMDVVPKTGYGWNVVATIIGT